MQILSSLRAFWKPAPIVLAAAVLGSVPARADTIQAALSGSYVQSVSSGGHVFRADHLLVGTSTGVVTNDLTHLFPTRAADDLNLASYFVRDGVADPVWSVSLGAWWDVNGSLLDFFLFEIGGNDAVQVQAVLPGGILGVPVNVAGWSSTGYSLQVGPNKGQTAFGLGFRSTDLKDAGGAFLTPQAMLAGVRVLSKDVDGAVFAAVDPAPAPPSGAAASPRASVRGDLQVWRPVEVWLQGPICSQLDDSPNPFLDYRLQVEFGGPQGQTFQVPGFFAGDGQGGATGRLWKARFAPDAPGTWTAVASFREGPGIAVLSDPLAGQPCWFDGAVAVFDVQPPDPAAEGFYKLGRLEYVDGHYLKFQNGPYFLKGGTNSPENLLAAYCFDDVQDSGNLGQLHRYEPHVPDWQDGDPLFWGDTSGAPSMGLIGALNYLSAHGVNSVYFLPMNLGGDGQDASPFVGQAPSAFDRRHYHVGRLEQWDQVFEHAQRKGILLHVVLGETETGNETWLDGGALGVERKLFLREMVARFSHHLAIKWNLGEEFDQPVGFLDLVSDHLRALDPYDHPQGVHSYPDSLALYNVIAGDSRYAATSMQYAPDAAGAEVEQLRALSAAAGHPWVVDMDENGSAQQGLDPTNMADMRKRVLYDVYFSGGNVEWYLGYHPLPIGGDVQIEDFRTREPMWDWMHDARRFIETRLPFWEMKPMDFLLSGEAASYGGGEVFAKPGEVYAVYLPSATSTGTLNLGGAPGTYVKRWFNPRTGAVEAGSSLVAGGGPVALGSPPSSPGEDWVVWLDRQ